MSQLPSVDAKLYPLWLAKLGLLCAVFSSFFLLWEWYSIGIMNNPIKIADYNFGSGSMLEKGGTHYSSAKTYAQSCLLDSLCAVPMAGLFVLAIRRNSGLATLMIYICWGLLSRLVSYWT